MINLCQVVFGTGCCAFVGVIYILALEIMDIFKINDTKINEKLLTKEAKNVSKIKKEDR